MQDENNGEKSENSNCFMGRKKELNGSLCGVKKVFGAVAEFLYFVFFFSVGSRNSPFTFKISFEMKFLLLH